jgi:hypothetical protein
MDMSIHFLVTLEIGRVQGPKSKKTRSDHFPILKNAADTRHNKYRPWTLDFELSTWERVEAHGSTLQQGGKPPMNRTLHFSAN